MENIEAWIESLKERILGGGELTFEEGSRLIEIEDEKALSVLAAAAGEITIHLNTNEAFVCSLVNAKSYLCGEDCAFCSQSTHYDTESERYAMMKPEEALKSAREFEKAGIRDFCVVTSGESLSDEDFETVLEIFRLLKQETTLNLDGSLGFLTSERIQRLKEAGVRRINNNLQTSREFYSKIVTTHDWERREEGLRLLRDEGMEICSGGILNLGESRLDRVRLAFALKPYRPCCLPVNVLNPRPGTPLENRQRLSFSEIVKTVAVFRFIHPKANIKLAGGREANLSEAEQITALKSGANGVIAGGYLTTGGNPIERDCGILKRAGFRMPEPPKEHRVTT